MADNVMNRWKHARRGFTLIELLTVIAIIAILAAIAYPVFNNVRKQQRMTTCMTQMHDLYRNLKLFKEDNNRYPASLLGYVQNTDGTFHTGSGQILGIEQLTYRPLTNEQKYIKDKNVFACPDNRVKDPSLVTTAVYPAGTPLAGQPVVFTSTIANNMRKTPPPTVGQPAYFYAYDSYDIGPMLNSEGLPVPNTYELHYSLDWTGVNGQGDAPNQLKYANTAPEDSTVVTWCTHHAALGSDRVPVIMLSGKANPVNAKQFVSQGPLNFRF